MSIPESNCPWCGMHKLPAYTYPNEWWRSPPEICWKVDGDAIKADRYYRLKITCDGEDITPEGWKP